ncbi:MAG: CDP-diacylglycerol--glycerol-3-phosphate 3-phosphatidyltransferase [Methylotenera sp.]|nr:CDP-diacylglycerol--glycerol-3-phosphate 3-phosphatidyltransferase [Methylotenera sp.]
MICNIPTMLTWLRILLIPVFVGVFYIPTDAQNFVAVSIDGLPNHWVNLTATTIFGVAAFTDWLDGYLARKLNQTSAFGAFLDPVADKLMVAAALLVLVEFERVGAIIALIIIGREIAISALREWMAGEGQSKSVGVAMIGKIKTAAQMIAILFLLYWDNIGTFEIKIIGQWLIALAAFLTLLSMAYYLKAALPKIRANK